jgi:hypothetical protein
MKQTAAPSGRSDARYSARSDKNPRNPVNASSCLVKFEDELQRFGLIALGERYLRIERVFMPVRAVPFSLINKVRSLR